MYLMYVYSESMQKHQTHQNVILFVFKKKYQMIVALELIFCNYNKAISEMCAIGRPDAITDTNMPHTMNRHKS